VPDSLPPEQAICGYTAQDFCDTMADLLPVGVVWPRDPDTDLIRTFSGLAVEYSRLHQRDCDLLTESYPGTCLETIWDWERICGLPDPCMDPPPRMLQDRRNAILAKLQARGGQDRQYYIDLAAIYGYTITITEYRPLIAGVGAAGDPVYHQSPGVNLDQWVQADNRARDWWFCWRVDYSPPIVITWFRAGQSTAGEPLADWQTDALMCLIEATKPAHTFVIYNAVP
jgi:uncharacterized protein YmfQ (DUF2313 family)